VSDGWPEQDAIDAWFDKYGRRAPFSEVMELKNEATKPRIEVQKQLEISKRDYEVIYKLQQAGEKEIIKAEQLLIKIKETLTAYSNNDVMGMGADEAIKDIKNYLESR